MANITLRPVRVNDLELLLAWRSNPEIYEHFREQEDPIAWKDHIEWFGTRSDDRRDFIIEYQGRRVGAIAVTEESEVSIYIGETALWGHGIAKAALRELTSLINDTPTAWIHRDNEASKVLFEQCGFEPVGGEEWLKYRYED